MTWIAASDPLALLALQTTVGTPARESAAKGNSPLDVPQVAAVLGEPVPIVFARRRNGQGGILISPKATEARFVNNQTTNAVTASYHLVISEGQVCPIERRDLYQGQCRVGSYTQTYNRRAGTWDPGNFIVPVVGFDVPDCPQYCGTVGTYPDISTLSYEITTPDGSDDWRKQVHAFIRCGMYVDRLFDNVFGPSDNFCDLIRWALLKTGKVPALLIDVATLTASAAFLERYGLTCNAYIEDSSNAPDFIVQWSRYFMLRETNVEGKKGLRPALPVTSQGELITDPITPVYTFTDDIILPGSFEVNYTPLSDRLPFVVQVIWRQQGDSDVGIIRTAEIRYANTALDGPYESHDLSAVCTNEAHAVRIGAYILSRRSRSNHSASLAARPQIHNKILRQGDIVRVRVKRETQNTTASFHDYYYQVERIGKTLAGDVSYELSHFPVDQELRSLITQDVLAAQPTGIVLPPNRTGPGCDLFSSDDRTLPQDTGRTGTDSPGVSISGGGGDGGGGGGGGDEPVVPEDPLDTPLPSPTVYPPGAPEPGSALVMPDEPCGPGIEPEWRWLGPNDEPLPTQNARWYVIGTADIQVGNQRLRGQLRCPGGDWQDTEPVDVPPVPTPQGREVERYWNATITRFGFVSGFTGWYSAEKTLYLEYDGAPFFTKYYSPAGGQAVNVNIILGTLGSNVTQRITGGMVPLDGRRLLWVVKSRWRDSPGDPWNVIEHEQIHGVTLS